VRPLRIIVPYESRVERQGIADSVVTHLLGPPVFGDKG
jgi:hypothetical protein